MASPPPPRHSKIKNARKAVKEVAKQFRSCVQPNALDSGGSSDDSASPFRSNYAAANGPRQTSTSELANALQALRASADLVPRFSAATKEVIGCLGIVQEVTSSAKEYEDLTSRLSLIACALREYLGELGLKDPVVKSSCESIALSIKAEVEYIQAQQGRSKIRQAVRSHSDRGDIIRCYRRVEALFQQLQYDLSFQMFKSLNAQHRTTLLGRVAPVDDARYNSSYSTKIDRRGCTKDTREKIQEDLKFWVQDSNGATVYWMNGMAGTGKTTIAYSLCEWLEADRKLGASFFCSRASSSCRNVDLILPTVAYGLACYSPGFRAALCKALVQDPGASKLNLVQQFKKLIQDPLRETNPQTLAGAVVVIDALDECEDDDGVRLVLQLLLRFSDDSRCHSPLKFFVTSRPEPTIRDLMLSLHKYPPVILPLHDVEHSIVEGDIRKYLAEGFKSMSPPPTDSQIEQLTKLSGKLFIYAATITRYILPGKAAVNSSARLDAVLAASSQVNRQTTSNKKYQQLDKLYSTILAIALDEIILEEEEIKSVRLILCTVVCAAEPMAIATLSSFLSLAQAQVLSALQPLLSVLHVSEPNQLVSTFHTSFPDYMLDPSRSGQFCCKQTQHNELITNRCFELMKDQLRFNICKFKTSSTLDKNVLDLEQRIRLNISPALFHACMYWGDHLRLASTSDVLYDELADFLNHRLLFWMEVLNVRRSITRCISILSRAEGWLSARSNSAVIRQLASDASDFVARFAASKCSGSTPHIYISALPFCAESSLVHARYRGRTRGLIDLQGTAKNRRNQLAQAVWMVDARVYSIALPRYDNYIVTGDDAGNIHIRDGQTGHLIDVPFPKHDGVVRSVALSRDGTRIASGFDFRGQHAIQVWNARTGDVITKSFGSLLGTVSSVGFSPDGKRIVSSSDTCTVRLWDAFTGEPIFSSFYGHTDSINSIALSPDGEHIASGSSDCTVRVWSAKTGDIVFEPFRGHTGGVNSVAFSPDNTYVISGSDDKTIGLWDAHADNPIANRLQGHMGPVNSVVFSPDGTLIVSGSSDATIRVWDAHTGGIVTEPLQGHEGPVKSVAFSPDGTRVASGSSDGTTLVWDARTGDRVVGPLGSRTKSVNSVAFSHDGACVVWGSDGGAIQTWDSLTGIVLAQSLFGHESNVRSVAFSCDDTRIVSGSDDHTIRLWDARTGHSLPEQLKGHTYPVRSVAFSHDSTQVISCSGGDIRVWSLIGSNPVSGPFHGHTDWVTSVAFSPNGSRIVSGSKDQTIRVWNASTAKLEAGPFEGHTDCVTSVTFSPNSGRIASGSNDKTIRVWDVRTGNLVAIPFRGHTSPIYCVAFSPDGSLIASGAGNGTLRVWHASTGNTAAGPFRGHSAALRSIAFYSDTRIISGSDDQSIRVHVCDVREEDSTRTTWHNSPRVVRVYAVAFSPDGGSITSVSDNGTVQIWDVHTGDAISKPFGEFSFSDKSVKAVALSADGSRVVLFAQGIVSQNVLSAQDGVVSSWSFNSELDLKILDTHNPTESNTSPRFGISEYVTSVAFSLDAERIAVGIAGGTIRLRDTRTGNFVADPLQGHTQDVSSIVFSRDGTRIASSSLDKTLVWDLSTRATVAGPCHEHPTSITFSPDGTHVASSSYGSHEGEDRFSDVGIWVWDSRAGNLVAGPFRGHTQPITSILFSSDGRRVISGSHDSTIQVWEVGTGEVRVLRGHSEGVVSVAVSPDGESIVSSSHDNVIRVWDLGSDADNSEVNRDGWVTNSSGLLFWAPLDIHSYLPRPCNPLLIGPEGTAFMNYKNLLLGERWTECYVP